MTRVLRSLAAAALVAAAAMVASPSEARILPQAATCGGVWVVVDYGSLGGTSTKCATSHDTGTKALKSAGFSPTVSDGMVLKISGKPSKPDINKAYWSYWHATQSADGDWSKWEYSTVGADGSHPEKGVAEGWRYQALSEGEVPPAIAPPDADTSTPTPSATKTSTKPSAKPSATKSPTKSPSATATATRSATASASATPTPTTSTTVAASATFTAAPTPSDATPLGADEAATPVPDASAAPSTDGGGSPIGAIAAGSAVVLAAGGLGGWWLLKGRKR